MARLEIAPELVSAMHLLRIMLVDSNADKDEDTIETVLVQIRTNAKRRGRRTRIDDFMLSETSRSSGEFVGYLQLTPDRKKKQGRLEVLPGDLIMIKYATGFETITAVVEVKAWDPEFGINQDAFDIGDIVKVKIADPGANRHPEAPDDIPIRVFSDADPKGIRLTATETGNNTAVFKCEFRLSREPSFRDSIQAGVGKTVTVAYRSEIAADYVERIASKKDPAQTFFFTIPIEGKMQEEIIPERIQQYFDPIILGRLERGNFLETTNRTITIVFWDIRGFSRLIDILRSSPKDATDFLNEYFDLAAEIISAYGGILDKYVGDEVMALFGVFSPAGETQNDAISAVRAALDFKHRFAQLVTKWTKKWATIEEQTIRVELGCGISTGEAIIGNFGGKNRIQFTAIGRAVNIANRIENRSKENRILISIRTRELVSSAFEVRYVGTLRRMKNIVGNYPYYEVKRKPLPQNIDRLNT